MDGIACLYSGRPACRNSKTWAPSLLLLLVMSHFLQYSQAPKTASTVQNISLWGTFHNQRSYPWAFHYCSKPTVLAYQGFFYCILKPRN